MHLRRSTALATGALLLAIPLSGCSALTGRDDATMREYVPANGTNNRDASVDVLGAVVVSAQPGSGTFVTTLVNNSAEDAASLTALEGTRAGNPLTVPEFQPIDVPARGLVNLANMPSGEGVTVEGDFEAGQFLRMTIDLSTQEQVTMDVLVVPDEGSFAGLDTSA